MATRNSLTQVQKQSMRLIPLQKQMGELLEMDPNEIEERIEQELDDNPALERSQDDIDGDMNKTEDGNDFTEDDKSISDYGDNNDDIEIGDNFYGSTSTEDDTPYYYRHAKNQSADDEFYQSPIIAEQSLSDYLLEQLREREGITATQHVIAEYIIGDLNENGYLSHSVSAIASDVTFNAGIEVEDEEVAKVLDIIREFDPPGIAASNVQECMLLQINRMPDDEITRLSSAIVKDNFEVLKNHRYDILTKRLHVDKYTLDKAITLIQSLNGKPANSFSSSRTDLQRLQITPDFRVDADLENKTLSLTVLNRVPELQISQSFKLENNRLIKNGGEKLSKNEKEQATFIRSKYNSANSFIDVLKMRQETLFKVMRSIMNKQKEYFLTGDPSTIKPMRLQDISDDINTDISVISRATSNKFVDSIWGVKPLKYFFSERLSTSSGANVSTREVKEAIRNIVDNEDKKSPYNDDQILKLLTEKGYNIKRRTVAKYREEMNIPQSKLRRN